MVKCAIFDLDGTLVDSMPYWETSAVKLLEKEGIKAEENLCDKFLSMSLPESADYLIKTYSLNYSNEEICHKIDDIMLENYINYVNIKPHIIDLLESFYNLGIKMAVASSTDRELIVACLKKLSLDKFFSFITTSTEIGKSKQHPDIYIKCANYFNVAYNETMIFEDLPYGIIATKSLGFITVGLYDKTSEKHQKTLEKYSKYYFKNIDESFVKKMIEIAGK